VVQRAEGPWKDVRKLVDAILLDPIGRVRRGRVQRSLVLEVTSVMGVRGECRPKVTERHGFHQCRSVICKEN